MIAPTWLMINNVHHIQMRVRYFRKYTLQIALSFATYQLPRNSIFFLNPYTLSPNSSFFMKLFKAKFCQVFEDSKSKKSLFEKIVHSTHARVCNAIYRHLLNSLLSICLDIYIQKKIPSWERNDTSHTQLHQTFLLS